MKTRGTAEEGWQSPKYPRAPFWLPGLIDCELRDVQFHAEHHLIRCVEKIQEADDTRVFDAKKNVDFVGEHFRLVLDQTLIDDFDGASLLSFLMNTKLNSRKVTTRKDKQSNQVAKRGAHRRCVSV